MHYGSDVRAFFLFGEDRQPESGTDRRKSITFPRQNRKGGLPPTDGTAKEEAERWSTLRPVYSARAFVVQLLSNVI